MLKVDDVGRINAYLSGVFKRAYCHANNVNAVCASLIGFILLKNDGVIKVREQLGAMRNQIWFSINGKTYNMLYNHDNECVELREGKKTLYSFDNSTSHVDIRDAFDKL